MFNFKPKIFRIILTADNSFNKIYSVPQINNYSSCLLNCEIVPESFVNVSPRTVTWYGFGCGNVDGYHYYSTLVKLNNTTLSWYAIHYNNKSETYIDSSSEQFNSQKVTYWYVIIR